MHIRLAWSKITDLCSRTPLLYSHSKPGSISEGRAKIARGFDNAMQDMMAQSLKLKEERLDLYIFNQCYSQYQFHSQAMIFHFVDNSMLHFPIEGSTNFDFKKSVKTVNIDQKILSRKIANQDPRLAKAML